MTDLIERHSDGWKRDDYFSRERESARTPRFFIHPSSSCNNEKKKTRKKEPPFRDPSERRQDELLARFKNKDELN